MNRRDLYRTGDLVTYFNLIYIVTGVPVPPTNTITDFMVDVIVNSEETFKSVPFVARVEKWDTVIR